jgi:hypothetical protein
MWRSRFPLLAAGVLAVAVSVPLITTAQAPPAGPFTTVEPQTLPLDRDGVWTLHFAFLPPRLLTVETPDKGKQQALYMVYRVWNTSDTPQLFIPEIELVTKDGEYRTFLDEPRPMVVRQIRADEDRTGEFKIKTSVEMSQARIPVTKPDSVPRAVYGVAVWMDVPEKAPKTNNFSVYVAGLSNGLAVSESDSGIETVSRKTLQLDFHRPTDELRPRQNDFTLNENKGFGASKWIYRVVPRRPESPKAKDGGK